MATKKPKRFEQGGLSDKDAGLEASKDDKVGFFERLRMGNIDEEGSEAYNRFGAGRGRAARAPAPAPVAASETRPSASAPEMDAMEAANMREPIPVPDGPKVGPLMIGGKPPVNVQASKPAATKPAASGPKMQEQTYRRTSGDTGEREQSYRRTGGATAEERAAYQLPVKQSKPSGGDKKLPKALVDQIPKDKSTVVGGERVDSTEMGRNISNTLAALGPGKLAGLGAIGNEMRGAKGVQEAYNKAAAARRTAEMRAKGDATKFATKPKSTQKNTAKKTKKFDDDESNVEFKRGGSVSSASKRGDGIASRGKTNCKMR